MLSNQQIILRRCLLNWHCQNWDWNTLRKYLVSRSRKSMWRRQSKTEVKLISIYFLDISFIVAPYFVCIVVSLQSSDLILHDISCIWIMYVRWKLQKHFYCDRMTFKSHPCIKTCCFEAVFQHFFYITSEEFINPFMTTLSK